MKKQNYKESAIILEEIKKANKILLNCHRGPDPDSIGNALAMKSVLENMGKEVTVICPSENLPRDVSFLFGYQKIRSGVDFRNFNFSNYELFITSDSSSWDMVSGDNAIVMPNIKTIVIDHHYTNTKFGEINLVDDKKAAVCELCYRIFEDWNITLTKDMATSLLSGIIGDTGIFKYPNTTVDTFEIASKLISLGAEKEKIIEKIYRSYSFNLIEFWKETLNRLKFDKEYHFIYSAIPYEIYESLGKPENAKETAIDLFSQTVVGTDFGFMALEKEKGKLSVSLRARDDFDTSIIAQELGGGGHKNASGGKVEGLEFDLAIEKVLEICRKYAKK